MEHAYGREQYIHHETRWLIERQVGANHVYDKNHDLQRADKIDNDYQLSLLRKD